uniref:Uncharacterized protein n=1 Tax=Anguilla anguilla TaxID=7936 RepID=A0A0E9TL89_ANGAN
MKSQSCVQPVVGAVRKQL